MTKCVADTARVIGFCSPCREGGLLVWSLGRLLDIRIFASADQ